LQTAYAACTLTEMMRHVKTANGQDVARVSSDVCSRPGNGARILGPPTANAAQTWHDAEVQTIRLAALIYELTPQPGGTQG